MPSSNDEMDAVLFSKVSAQQRDQIFSYTHPHLFVQLRRRVRGMSIRLARQIMKVGGDGGRAARGPGTQGADRDEDGQIDLREAQLIAFEQEGIGPAEVVEMLGECSLGKGGKGPI